MRSKHEQKKLGAVYTPEHIAQYMIEMVKPTPTMTIVEPSCGHGNFIFALIEYIKATHQMTQDTLLQWFLQQVSGFDIAEQAIVDLQNALAVYFSKECQLQVLPSLFTNMKVQDGLVGDAPYDLAIGNPPYIRTKNLEEQYLQNMRAQFESCKKGNVDIYYAFVEKYAKQCKNVCLIIPNSLFTNVSAKKLRQLVMPRMVAVIDFQEKLVFEDARTYTAIIHMSEKNTETYTLQNDFHSSHTTCVWEENHNKPKRGEVLSGIATLADKIFIVKQNAGGKLVAFDDVGRQYLIEDKYVAKFHKLTKFEESSSDYIIYPYDDEKQIIPESDIQTNAPIMYEYLMAMKTKLLNRDKGKQDKYPAWYAYGRKQGLHSINQSKYIVIPLMIGGDCQPFCVDGTTLLNGKKMCLFSSGFLIAYSDILWNRIQSTEFKTFLETEGKRYPGKSTPYYSVSATDMSHFIHK